MNNGDQTTMDRINKDKVMQLARVLEAQGRSPHYVIGWLESLISSVDSSVRLNKRQIKAFNQMLDDNVRWAAEPK